MVWCSVCTDSDTTGVIHEVNHDMLGATYRLQSAACDCRNTHRSPYMTAMGMPEYGFGVRLYETGLVGSGSPYVKGSCTFCAYVALFEDTSLVYGTMAVGKIPLALMLHARRIHEACTHRLARSLLLLARLRP